MHWRMFRESWVFRYGLAVAMAGLGLVVRLAMDGWLPPGFPYLTFFPAIIVTTYFVGARPAILCATLSGLASWYYFIGPPVGYAMGVTSGVAIGFFAFVVAVDIFFIDGMRRTVTQLAAERERYERLTESQDLLYRELHHRVSNNIQVVGALLRLQAAGVKDGDARHALQEAGGRIEVIAKIQRELHNRVGDPEPFRIFAQSLLNDANVAAGTQAIVSIEGGEQPLHSDQATPVTLVLLECFNNALEHAFVGGRDGAVAVQLDQDGADHVLTVRDNGAGPPEGFDPAKSSSLGLRIVRAMAGQLGGRFEMTRGDGWTTCRLTYPALTEN